MKRKLIALGIFGSPVLLTIACVAAVGFTCAIGWWLSGSDNESSLVRIMQLAPLSTPRADALPGGPDAPTQQEVGAVPQSSQTETTGNRSPVPQNRSPITQAEINEARGFSLPTGSVNSITQEGVATRLVIPRLNLDTPVVLSPIENQTWKVEHLGAHSVGHLEGTAPPGSDSNIVLAAHVTVSKDVYGPFAALSDLGPGDQIYIYYGADVFEYLVDDYQTVDRTAIQVTHPTQTGRVTLITCSNWSDADGRYLDRLVVTGSLNKG